MFNDFYFDKTVDSLNLTNLQASTKQLNVVSIPLNDGLLLNLKQTLLIILIGMQHASMHLPRRRRQGLPQRPDRRWDGCVAARKEGFS